MLSWTEPAFTDSLPTLRYLLYTDSGVPGSSEVVYNSTAMNVLQFNHTGLTPGALYAYWFRIENFNGLSPDLLSDPASQVARRACAIPAAFASLEVIGKSSTAITIQWREPGISTGCPIRGYSVLADDGAAGTLQAVALPGAQALLPATTYSLEVSSPAVHSLVVGSEHRFAVVAVSDVGQVQSNIVAATVADLPAAPSAAPVVVLAETGTDHIRLVFNPLDGSDQAQTGGSAI